MTDEKPWYAPGHADSLQGAGCTPRPRERLWTLVKGGKRVDAELLFHGEHGVEVQFPTKTCWRTDTRSRCGHRRSRKPSITASG